MTRSANAPWGTRRAARPLYALALGLLVGRGAPAGAAGGLPAPDEPAPAGERAAATGEPRGDEEPAPAGEPRAAPAGPEEDAVERCQALAEEGRAHLARGRFADGAARIRAALDQAERCHLDRGTQAALWDILGLALCQADDDEGAVAALRQAVALAPRDAELHLDLARALLGSERPDQARAELRQAQALGLRGEAEASARATGRDLLRQRLLVRASVDFGYDSNIQEGALTQTIANRSSQAAGASQGAAPPPPSAVNQAGQAGFQDPASYQALLRNGTAPASSQWGLPTNQSLEVGARLPGPRWGSLWLGYRFSQSIVTAAQQDGNQPDKDTYQFQQHALGLWLHPRTPRWLDLRLYLEGFANFSGLSSFTPFQGGVNGALEVTLRESPRWRTLLDYGHNARFSFDQESDGYLNGNRDTVVLAQEARVRWLRAQLGYQLTYDATGTLTTETPFTVGPFTTGGLPCPDAAAGMTALRNCLGNIRYQAPLSYLGNQVFASARLALPRGVGLLAALRYERRSYLGEYVGQYSGVATTADAPEGAGAPGATLSVASLPTFTFTSARREDDRVALDLAAGKDLGHGLTVEVLYGFLSSTSTINNLLDNRSFLKHTLVTRLSYAF